MLKRNSIYQFKYLIVQWDWGSVVVKALRY
jgi:hypothetical protein